MAVDVQALVREAERLALPFVAKPIDMYRCPTHPDRELQQNHAGLLICAHRAHWPDRDDGEE